MPVRDQCMTNGEYQRLLFKLNQTLWRFGLDMQIGGGKIYREYVEKYRRYTELTDGDI